MVEESSSDDEAPERSLIKREVEPVEDEANFRVLETIADVEGVEVTDLPPLYERIDHILDHLFDNPPAPEAQVVITFSYHGYRVRVDQDGHVELARLNGAPEEWNGQH
ncbi:HalOD1 output domain-containing protein [Haloarcula salina]|uniref:HalOD1 output domain-containing protein n=1 Tax=Haloarcula salina TaxID=1429914 RepID=UPI003C6EF08A